MGNSNNNPNNHNNPNNSNNTSTNSKTLLAALLAGFIGGFFGARACPPVQYTPQSSADSSSVSSAKAGSLTDIASELSKGASTQAFVQAEKSTHPYADKVGFKYEIQHTELHQLPNTAGLPMLGIFFERAGMDYTFEIEDGLYGITEILRLSAYNNTIASTGTVSIQDANHNLMPDRILVFDHVNNTDISLRRMENGTIEYTGPVDSAGAKIIYDWCTDLFRQFKKEAEIDKLVAEYKPKVEIAVPVPKTMTQQTTTQTTIK